MRMGSRGLVCWLASSLVCAFIWAAEPAIVFVDEAPAGARSIMVMDTDGANREEVFRTAKRYGDGAGGPWLSPSISPEGDWVAYVYEEGDEGPGWAVWKVGTGTDNTPYLLLCSSGPEGLVVLETPQWSPDGSEIAAVRRDFFSGLQSIVVVPADGLACGIQPEVVFSTSTLGLSQGVTWSSGGESLAFVASNASGTDFLVTVPRGNGDAVFFPIVWPPEFLAEWPYKEPHALDWKRSGGLAFALDTYAEDGTERLETVWTLDVVGGTATTAAIAEGRSPSWSLDDAQLLFAGPLGLTRVTVATGDVELLGSGDGPDWRRGSLVEICTVDADCDDSNPCTVDTCNAGECLNPPEANDTPCGDYAFCRSGGCFEAECGYLDLPICDDLEGCTVDSCVDYRCSFEFDPGIPGCSGGLPGDPCTTGADCLSGLCHPKKGVCK